MGLFDRVERKLESVVNGAFARAFKAEVQPVEIASAMRRAMDDRAAVVSKGRTIVPNHFTVELAPKDYERLITFEGTLTNELVASVEEHAESQRFVPGGPMAVHFTRDDALETGVFRVVADTDASPAAPSPAAPAAPPPPAPAADAAAAVDAAAEAKHRRAAPADDDAAAAAPTPEPPRPPLKTNADEPSPAEHAEEEHDTYRPRRSIPSRARQHEAAAPAEGAISMASHAASAAGGALAGTAAAGRAGTPHGHLPDDADELDAAAAPAGTAPAPATPPPPPPPPNAQVNPVERPWLDVDGDSYPLLGALTVIGRDTSADITLNDPGISRRHCEVRVTPDGRHLKISVRDLGSTNGTFVNGERVTSQHVEPGDRLTLGRLSLHLRSGRR